MANNPPKLTPIINPTSSQSESIDSVDLELHLGPLPQARDFADYEQVLPGAAHRILKMAEREQISRLRLRWADWLANFVALVLGRLFLYALLGAAVYLAINDKPIEALLAGIAPIVVTIYANTRPADSSETGADKADDS